MIIYICIVAEIRHYITLNYIPKRQFGEAKEFRRNDFSQMHYCNNRKTMLKYESTIING